MAVVRGLTELNRAFVLAGTKLHKNKNQILRHYARPVERTAETLAMTQIDRMTLPWAQMRIGSTPEFVYVAPQQRGTRILSRKRPKFGRLLMRRAMEPALEANREQIARGLDELLARLEREWGTGG
jgi:hypothetical protein